MFDDHIVNFELLYFNGYESNLDKINYKLSCYHVKGKCAEKTAVIKEWMLNGSQRGLYFVEIQSLKYKAFDVHFVDNKYDPQWSVNLSISFLKKYGRIPSVEERKIIRDYSKVFKMGIPCRIVGGFLLGKHTLLW